MRRYSDISPSMVERGEWGPGDDRRMLRALWRGGWDEEFEVQWGGLVEGRSDTQVGGSRGSKAGGGQ